MSLWICLRWPEAAQAAAQAQLQHVALAMLQFSPNVACFRGHSVLVEVAASLSLFGGIHQLCQRIGQTAAAVSGPMNLGMAPSASGAWLLAGASVPGARRVVRIHTLMRHLDPLPVRQLPEALPHLRWLENIGCLYLGDLRRLPRQGLQQRSSTTLLNALDAAYGQIPDTIPWLLPPGRFRLAHEPDFHIYQAQALLGAAQPLLQALCVWLQSRQEALHDLQLVLHHEKGRHACPPTSLGLRFSAATWHIEDFNRLLKERLQHFTLQRAAIRLELIAGPAHPRAPANETLFPDPARQAQEERRLLDLLAARLGNDGIRRPRPQPHHLPELANVWVTDTTAAPLSKGPNTPASKPRPFWLLAQPEPLQVQRERPVHQGRPLRLIQGPERLESGWYLAHSGDQPLKPSHMHHRRDYFVAEDAHGARYWVYRERETGESWFLHGLFA